MAFDVMEVTMEMVKRMRGPLAKLKAVDGELAGQARRALQSVALNIAEASGRAGRDGRQHYRIALGSLRETTTALRIAIAWDYVAEPEMKEILLLADRAGAMLYRLSPR